MQTGAMFQKAVKISDDEKHSRYQAPEQSQQSDQAADETPRYRYLLWQIKSMISLHLYQALQFYLSLKASSV